MMSGVGHEVGGRLRRWAAAVAIASALAGCHASGGGGEAASKPPPVAVKTEVLREVSVEDASEYLATLSSRTSVGMYSQVVGHVSAIYVKPGDAVRAGAALVQIDPQQQLANLNNLQAAKRAREAGLGFARAKSERASSLVTRGIVSQQEFEQAKSESLTAEAEINAYEAQIKAQESELRFFKIAAPFDGVVGDIPVKLGDLVTTATKLTSVDRNAVLEAYVNVPVDRAADITTQTHVRLLDGHGAILGDSPLTFVAEQANVDTQSVLVKGQFPNGKALRASQMVRAQVVWSSKPGVRVPVTAVTRVAGQYFVYVAGPGEGGVKAEQRSVELGAIDGNEYVVRKGLAAGERVIVSGVQKVRDGARVEPQG